MTDQISPDEKHRRLERLFWIASIVVAVLGWGGALVAAYEAYLSYIEAHKQAETAIKQLQDTEEPSINMIGFKVAHVYEHGNIGQLQIDPIFKNGGTSPANTVRVRAESQLCLVDKIPGGFFPSINADTDDVPTSIGGLETRSNISRHQLSLKQIENLRNGNLRAFFYGTITYDKLYTYGSHITRYCYALTGLPPDDKIEGVNSLNDLYLCGSNSNCTDETCEDTPKIALVCSAM